MAPAEDSPAIVVIPARGGSQRVPGKNIRPIAGLPALVRTISACAACPSVERIVVSTDSDEIAALARDAGADVPFTRPEGLADAHTGIIPVLQHAVGNLDLPSDARVACVYATAVTMAPADLESALRLLDSAHFVVSITTFDYPIQRALAMAEDGTVGMVEPDNVHTRSQDLPERWHDAGQFVWGTASTWTTRSSVWEAAIGFPIPRWRVIDIDTQEDWERAEILLRLIESTTSRG